MRLTDFMMEVKQRKRKLFVAALMSIIAGGCASSDQRRASFAENARKPISESPRESISWEEVLAESSATSSGNKVQPVGFNDAVVVEVPTTDLSEDAEEAGAADTAVEGEALQLPSPSTEVDGSPQPVDYFVGLALAQHPSIQAARLRVSAEVNRIPQVRALPDPMFNNQFFPSHDQSIQTAAGRVGNQMSLSQAIPWPEKLRTKAAIVNQEVQIAQAEVNRIEREIAEAVRLAYYEVWFATRAASIIEETKDLIDDLTKVAEARYRSGGTQQDVLRAQLESDRLDDQLVSLAKQKQVAQADLAALVQQPVTLLAEASEDLGLTDVPAQLDELIALAEQCNPKLAGLAWEIQRDRQKHKLACLQQYPRFASWHELGACQ